LGAGLAWKVPGTVADDGNVRAMRGYALQRSAPSVRGGKAAEATAAPRMTAGGA
jgi:hypothetical protein